MRLIDVVLVGLVAVIAGCAESAESDRDSSVEFKVESVSIASTPAAAVSPGPSGGGHSVVSSVGFRVNQSAGEASVVARDVATVEELPQHGLHIAGVSPVHLALRGTPAASSVR